MDRPTDVGLRAKILTDFRIRQCLQIAVSPFFLARVMDFACNKFWIADLTECQKYFVFTHRIEILKGRFITGSTDLVL